MIDCFENKKGFDYYLALPIIKMGSSNMLVPFGSLDDEMKLGIYYLCKIYHIGFHRCVRADWEWFMFSQGEDGDYLSGDQIKKMNMDLQEYNKCKTDFQNGIFPNGYKGTEHRNEFEYAGKFGWLSPDGTFVISGWGTHESTAYNIVCEKGWEDDFVVKKSDLGIAGDYLCEERGYALIHNPCNDGGYIVTNIKPLTKKQKEFLYDYFVALGNRIRAEHYIEED